MLSKLKNLFSSQRSMSDKCNLDYSLLVPKSRLDDEEKIITTRTIKEVAGLLMLCTVLVTITMVVLGIIFFCFIPTKSSFTNEGPISLSCGNTSATAKANDCVLDIISRSWLPKECLDKELIEEFSNIKTWHWYKDQLGEQEVDKEIVESGFEGSLYVTWEYHFYHCTYMWKKLHRAVLRNSPIDSYIGSYAHTTHCAAVLVRKEVAWDLAQVHFGMKFPFCTV